MKAIYLLIALSLMQIPLGLAYAEPTASSEIIFTSTGWADVRMTVENLDPNTGHFNRITYPDGYWSSMIPISYVNQTSTDYGNNIKLSDWRGYGIIETNIDNQFYCYFDKLPNTIAQLDCGENIPIPETSYNPTPEPTVKSIQVLRTDIVNASGDVVTQNIHQGDTILYSAIMKNISSETVDFVFNLEIDGNPTTKASTLEVGKQITLNLPIPSDKLGSNHVKVDIFDSLDNSILVNNVVGEYIVKTPTPIPEIPTNSTTTEPIPIPENFSICHKGKTITANERSFTAHESHGDTFGACKIDEPINNSTSFADPDYSAIVTIPKDIQFMKVCHSNVLTTVPVDTVRYHLKHGDQQFSCPDKGAKMFVDTINLSDFTIEELVSLVTRIMMELMKR